MNEWGRKWRFMATIAVFCGTALAAGCGSSEQESANDSGESASGELREENARLREENEQLQGEVESLQSEVESLREEVAEAREATEASPAPEAPEDETTASEEVQETEPERSSGGELAVAGPGDLRGEPAPEIMPDDFPLPSDAVLSIVSEDYYSFNLDFALDADLQSLTSFYDEQLEAQGWTQADRTEYEQDGLEGTETTWERGTFIPSGSPNEPAYEQVKESLNITLQEIEPSGVAGRLLWNDGELLDENYEAEEGGASEGRSS